MNPGTSEMHFVAALDDVPEMRGVLALFEGVATGAADGYARMTDRPAATLLHLGPGLGNGLANLHNARKARTPGRQHRRRPRHLPQAVRRAARVRHRDRRPQRVALDPHVGRDRRGRPRRGRRRRGRVRPARPGRDPRSCPPTSRGATAASPRRRSPPPRRGDGRRRRRRARSPRRCARANRPRCSSAGRACRERGIAARPRAIADATGAKLLVRDVPGPPRARRRAGRRSTASPTSPSSRRCSSTGLRHLVLVDAKAPVSFFAYPDKAS